MAELVKLMGLWKNTAKDGNTMLSGFLGSAKVLILKNKEKIEDKDHDYFLFITPAPPRDKKPAAPAAPSARSDEDSAF